MAPKSAFILSGCWKPHQFWPPRIVSAVEIASCDPQSLTMVTKCLYPQFARLHGTNWKAVERNIRSAIDIIWKRNPLGLQRLSSCRMDTKPANAQFISLLVFYLQFDES